MSDFFFKFFQSSLISFHIKILIFFVQNINLNLNYYSNKLLSMKQYIEIKAENYEGDNFVSRNEITNQQLKFIEPVINAIKNFKPYTTKNDCTHSNNFPTGNYLISFRNDIEELSAEELYVDTNLCKIEQLKKFEKLCPQNEFGIKTITDIDIIYVANETKLL